MTIPKGHKSNFETLKEAFKAGDVALMECKDAKTGKPVVVLCMVGREGGEYVFTPAAKFFDGNPYEELLPPTQESDHGSN